MYIVVVIVHGKFLKALLEMVVFAPVVTEDLFFCDKSCDLIYRLHNKNSEYDQEMPESQTADKPMARLHGILSLLNNGILSEI